MARLAIYVIGALVSTAVLFVADPDGGLFAVASGFAIGFAIPLIDAVILHFRYLKIAWYSLRTWKSRVRVSVSYLYRIQVDHEYLLVKGVRFDQYQPVGGVYKFHPASSGIRNEMNVLDDDLLQPDEVSEGDLRVRIPGKHLLRFVRWFESGTGRETDGWREFYEELVAPGLLPKSVFRYVKYDRVGRHYQPMRYSQWAKSQELLIADIFEILPTQAQTAELRKLKKLDDVRIFWASEDQIRRLGAADGAASQTTKIAQTAAWTIDAAN